MKSGRKTKGVCVFNILDKLEPESLELFPLKGRERQRHDPLDNTTMKGNRGFPGRTPTCSNLPLVWRVQHQPPQSPQAEQRVKVAIMTHNHEACQDCNFHPLWSLGNSLVAGTRLPTHLGCCCRLRWVQGIPCTSPKWCDLEDCVAVFSHSMHTPTTHQTLPENLRTIALVFKGSN